MAVISTDIKNMAHASLKSLASFCVLKDLNVKYLWANQQFCDAFNLPYREVAGKQNNDFFLPACSNEINATDNAIANNNLNLESAHGCLITHDDRIFPIMGTKGKITLGNGEQAIMGDCFILQETNPIKVFLDERITQKLQINNFESLNTNQLKIIYCLLCFPAVKLKEIAHLLCIANNTIYKEVQNIRIKLGKTSQSWLLEKMYEIGFFDTFFLTE